MPEYPIPHLAQKFHELFNGNADVYGRSEMTGEVDSNGKHVAKSWTEKEPVTPEVWETHLKGEKSIGLVPIRTDGTVTWIAFDIDVYKDGLNVAGFLERIEALNLPILLTRSKSGGAHGLVFFSEPVNMETIRPKIQEIATFFEIAGCEVFPKQDRLGSSDTGDVRYGNWLNMPYDGPASLRYGYKNDSEGFNPSEFIDAAEALKTNLKDFEAIEFPRPEETLEHGPPCLNHLTANKMDMKGGRNTLLFNLSTYFKKRNPEATKEALYNFLIEYNGKFSEPLEEKEVRATVLKSSSKKEYHYQCGNPLLKRHCNSHICKQCLYGIDGDTNAFDPNNKTLIQFKSDPCLYFIDYQKTQLVLSKEELWGYERLRQACMEQAHHIPPKMDQEHWLNLVQGYLESMTVIELPPEATAEGQLIEILQTWRKKATYNKDFLNNGQPVLDKKDNMYFRNHDLKMLLKMEQFNALPDNRISEVLKNKLMADYIATRSDGKVIKAWKIGKQFLEGAVEISLQEPEEPKESF